MANTTSKIFLALGYSYLANQTQIEAKQEPIAPEAAETEDSQAVNPQIVEEQKILPDMQVLKTLNIQPKISGMRV